MTATFQDGQLKTFAVKNKIFKTFVCYWVCLLVEICILNMNKSEHFNRLRIKTYIFVHISSNFINLLFCSCVGDSINLLQSLKLFITWPTHSIMCVLTLLVMNPKLLIPLTLPSPSVATKERYNTKIKSQLNTTYAKVGYT